MGKYFYEYEWIVKWKCKINVEENGFELEKSSQKFRRNYQISMDMGEMRNKMK